MSTLQVSEHRDTPDGLAALEEASGPRGGKPSHDLKDGIKAGLPFVLPTLAIGMSFGVLAEPLMGAWAAIAMSILVFSGAAQFASVSILVAGGSLFSAVSAGLLINTRFLPMGLAVAPTLKGGPLRRAAEGQTMIDASWALANRGDGTFDREIMMGATFPQAAAWWIGTAIGAFGGALVGDPAALGLDAMFPAFYLALLAEELRDRSMLSSALLGAAIAIVLIPFAPPGIPVVAASAAALLGLRRSAR
ncbi:MAG TPA: AzlC family ABC transporter permease [Solirubrobacteraceae bacterium]|nr:AzlC family ABC transporter permease [Solirubrobacteraceae bacterium]